MAFPIFRDTHTCFFRSVLVCCIPAKFLVLRFFWVSKNAVLRWFPHCMLLWDKGEILAHMTGFSQFSFPQPGLKAQLAAAAPGLSCRHFWLQMTFLFTQFSSTCSYQCFGEVAGKTEDSRSWVFCCWRWSIQSVPSTSSLCPHTSWSPTHYEMLQLLFPHCPMACSPNYFSPVSFLTRCQTEEDTWTLPSSLFIPSCSGFLLLPCMVPWVKVFALPPSLRTPYQIHQTHLSGPINILLNK